MSATASLTRENAHKFSLRWFARTDLVAVQKVLGPSVTEAIAAATEVLATNGLAVTSFQLTPTGNATLITEVTQ